MSRFFGFRFLQGEQLGGRRAIGRGGMGEGVREEGRDEDRKGLAKCVWAGVALNRGASDMPREGLSTWGKGYRHG